jgi:hypothetical protein
MDDLRKDTRQLRTDRTGDPALDTAADQRLAEFLSRVLDEPSGSGPEGESGRNWTGVLEDIHRLVRPDATTQEVAQSRPSAEEGYELMRHWFAIGSPRERQLLMRIAQTLAKPSGPEAGKSH